MTTSYCTGLILDLEASLTSSSRLRSMSFASSAAASLLGCKMESLISDLRHQYAASATVAVSQAMLLQALDRSRQAVASRISAQQTNKINGDASNLLNQTQVNQNSTTSDQHAPLDLSVKSQVQDIKHQTTRSRSQSKHQLKLQQRQQEHAAPLNLYKAPSGAHHKRNNQARNSNASTHSDNNDLRRNATSTIQSIKLITSSTSPSSSAASSSSSSTSSSSSSSSSFNKQKRGPATTILRASPTSYPTDANNNQLEEVSKPATFAAQHHDLVISSTNVRRVRSGQSKAARGKKQKGAKSHLCNFCGRSFSRSDMLTRHSRLHSGLKPYQCGKCYQVFSRSDHLSTHERTHTGEKPYQCDHCDYSACRRDMITRHMRTHTAGDEGVRETKVRARRRRRRENIESTDSSDKIGERTRSQLSDEDDVSTSFDISVTDP